MKWIRVDLLMFDRLQDKFTPASLSPKAGPAPLKDTSLWILLSGGGEDPHFYRMLRD